MGNIDNIYLDNDGNIYINSQDNYSDSENQESELEFISIGTAY